MSSVVKARNEIIRKRDGKCSYNVTLRLFRANIVAVEKLCVLQILGMFSLKYPAYNAHAQCCHLWPARLYSKFSHCIITDTILEKKKLLNIKYGFLIFSGTFARNFSHSKNT